MQSEFFDNVLEALLLVLPADVGIKISSLSSVETVHVLQAKQRGTSQWQLLTELQTAAATFSGILEKVQAQSVAAKEELSTAKYNMECALSVRDADLGREAARRAASEQAGFQGTQQPTQSTADGSGGSRPTPVKSPSRSIATQPRSPPPHVPASSPTLAAAPEPTQQKDEAASDVQMAGSAADAGAIVADSDAAAVGGDAQGDASADAIQASSFVLNHLIGGQPRSSVNTPSFGNGSALQQAISGSAHGFAATEADLAGPAGQSKDTDMQDDVENDERENHPANGVVLAEKAGAPVEKECSQRGTAHSSVKPTLQLSLQGRDRFGVESHKDEYEFEFDDME